MGAGDGVGTVARAVAVVEFVEDRHGALARRAHDDGGAEYSFALYYHGEAWNVHSYHS